MEGSRDLILVNFFGAFSVSKFGLAIECVAGSVCCRNAFESLKMQRLWVTLEEILYTLSYQISSSIMRRENASHLCTVRRSP